MAWTTSRVYNWRVFSPFILTLILVASLGPQDVVARFSEVYVRQEEPVGLLDGSAARELEPFLSKRLLRTIAELRACQADWNRQQIKGEINKPPYVDCCLFSGVPDGPPNKFVIGSSEKLADGRMKVVVEFSLETPTENIKWQDAYLLVKEEGRWLIDDLIAHVDDPRSDRVPLTGSYTSCRQGKWVGARDTTSQESCAAAAEPTALKIENGSGITPPKSIYRREPLTPASVRGRGAVAIIEAVIGEDGKPRHVCLLEGDEEWGTAVVAAFREWTFEPATLSGKKVAVVFRLTAKSRPR